MKIKSTILTTLRVINTIIDNLETREYYYRDSRAKFKDYDRDMPDDYLIKLLNRAGITKEDYPVIANILKSMALMTSGTVELVHYPEEKGYYDPDEEYEWYAYFYENKHLHALLQHLGVDLDAEVTRDDYASASKMLRVLGSSILDEEEVREMFGRLGIEQEFGITQKVAAGRKNLQIPKTLYRGLRGLSQRAYTKVTTIGYLWDIGKSVSTSMKRNAAERFAKKKEDWFVKKKEEDKGYRIVFVINNPRRQGFLVDNISSHGESEVILSGKLKVTWFATPKIGRPYAIIYVDLI